MYSFSFLFQVEEMVLVGKGCEGEWDGRGGLRRSGRSGIRNFCCCWKVAGGKGGAGWQGLCGRYGSVGTVVSVNMYQFSPRWV